MEKIAFLFCLHKANTKQLSFSIFHPQSSTQISNGHTLRRSPNGKVPNFQNGRLKLVELKICLQTVFEQRRRPIEQPNPIFQQPLQTPPLPVRPIAPPPVRTPQRHSADDASASGQRQIVPVNVPKIPTPIIPLPLPKRGKQPPPPRTSS